MTTYTITVKKAEDLRKLVGVNWSEYAGETFTDAILQTEGPWKGAYLVRRPRRPELIFLSQELSRISANTTESDFRARVEVEINLNWAKANPELFADRVIKFQNEYNNGDWKISVDLSRDRYMVMTAERIS